GGGGRSGWAVRGAAGKEKKEVKTVYPGRGPPIRRAASSGFRNCGGHDGLRRDLTILAPPRAGSSTPRARPIHPPDIMETQTHDAYRIACCPVACRVLVRRLRAGHARRAQRLPPRRAAPVRQGRRRSVRGSLLPEDEPRPAQQGL